MIKREKVDGKEATVVYLNDKFEMADEDSATLVKVIFDDGRILFLKPVEEKKRHTGSMLPKSIPITVPPYGNVEVLANPTKDMLRNKYEKLAEGRRDFLQFRLMREGHDYFIWLAEDAVHPAVARGLGLDPEPFYKKDGKMTNWGQMLKWGLDIRRIWANSGDFRTATVVTNDPSTGLRVLKNPGPQEVQNLPRHPEEGSGNRTFKVSQVGSDVYVWDAYFGWHCAISDKIGIHTPSSQNCLEVKVGRRGPKDGQVWANDGYDLVPFHKTSPNFQRAFSFLTFSGDFA